MIKTRAYLCQTVITADASPMKRVVSNILGRARQAFDGFFRRGGDVGPRLGRWEGTTRLEVAIPVPVQGRASIVSNIHANNRWLLAGFLGRRQSSGLVRAMSRACRGEIRGLGKNIATFGFVGVGLAAGSEWNMYKDDGDLQMDSVFRNIREIFTAKQSVYNKSLEMMLCFQPNGVSCMDQETSLNLNLSFGQEEESSFIFISPETSISDESDFTMLSDEEEDLVEDNSCCIINNHSLHVSEETLETSISDESDFTILSDEEEDLVEDNSCCIIDNRSLHVSEETLDKTRKDLREMLKAALVRVDEQSKELVLLRTYVNQLNAALREFTCKGGVEKDCNSSEELGVTVSEIPNTKKNFELLSLAVRQSQELHSLREITIQNQLLMKLENQANNERFVVVRDSFCKRDACCGPGSLAHN